MRGKIAGDLFEELASLKLPFEVGIQELETKRVSSKANERIECCKVFEVSSVKFLFRSESDRIIIEIRLSN